MSTNIDNMVYAGMDYARHGMPVPDLQDDLDLSAFNLGIRLANEKHSLAVPKLKFIKSFVPAYKQNISNKELSTAWGIN